MAYFVAGSYVRFLIETMFQGDARKFLELYRTGDYRAVLGEPVAEDAAPRVDRILEIPIRPLADLT